MSHEERRWMRHLGGELSEAETEALRRAASKDPVLAERLGSYDDLWRRLEGPPEGSVDGAFSRQVVDAARRIQTPLTWRQAPAWVRLGAAASLLLGVTLGSVAGAVDANDRPALDAAALEDLVFASPGLADGYWALLDEPDPWGDAPDGESSPQPRPRP